MKARTSDASPIRVDWLPRRVVGLKGRIGLTLAPGKKDPAGGWDRDLDADLARLRDRYRAGLLVCLVEDRELRILGIADLPRLATMRGIETVRLPIPDGGVPSDEKALFRVVRRILRAATEGKNVVVHCRGGLGRTGLVVACCLVALGSPPRGAISAVRRARAGAIETEGQEALVHLFSEAWHSMSLRSRPRS